MNLIYIVNFDCDNVTGVFDMLYVCLYIYFMYFMLLEIVCIYPTLNITDIYL